LSALDVAEQITKNRKVEIGNQIKTNTISSGLFVQAEFRASLAKCRVISLAPVKFLAAKFLSTLSTKSEVDLAGRNSSDLRGGDVDRDGTDGNMFRFAPVRSKTTKRTIFPIP